MKMLKFFFTLLFVSVVIEVSTILWKNKIQKEEKSLSTAKVVSKMKFEDEDSTKSVEKIDEEEENKNQEECEVTEAQLEVENNNENQSSMNNNQSTQNNQNQSSEKKDNHQSNPINLTNNHQNQQVLENNNEIQQKKQETESNNEVKKNENNTSSSSENLLPKYTIQNDIPADPRLKKDKATYAECEEYGQSIIALHPTECQYGCAVSCRSVMGKYTGETIGFMLTIRIMDDVGTVLPFSRD